LKSVPVKDCPESVVETLLKEAFAKKKAES
jgi:hypothetical protein